MGTVLVSTRGFKNELCHSRSVLVSAHCFKNELCFLCSVLVLTHCVKNDLCYMCTVLVSTHGSTHAFKKELCCMLGFTSLDLGFKERVILHVQCACFDSRPDFRRFHRNRRVSSGSDGPHRTIF